MQKDNYELIEKTYGIPKSKIITVSDVTQHINRKIVSDPGLKQVYVIGEITNISKSLAGHIYFNIKDEKSQISCIYFKDNQEDLNFEIEMGLKVIVLASVRVYEARSQYQLDILSIYPIGEGVFYLRYKQLKEKLEKEGLFNEIHKKPLPTLPRCVGIITSKTGAVIRDMLKILNQRFPNVNIKIAPTSVQGREAHKNIIHSIELMNKIDDVDVIIIARGGGPIEDLMCFNEESLARCIFKSRIPIVSAIGHETDYTISDFVADARASTPSVAAKIVVPEKEGMVSDLMNLKSRLEKAYNNYLESKRKESQISRYKIMIILLIIIFIIIIGLSVFGVI